MIVGDIVTNGERFGDQQTSYLYRVVAIHRDHAWVIAENGTFAGEYLTFKKEALT